MRTFTLPLFASWLPSSSSPAFFELSPREAELSLASKQISTGLSVGANIVLPNSARWPDMVSRGSYPRVSPSYDALIEVATEEDVQLVVSVAARYDIPFLVVTGAHGWTKSLNRLQGGIQINMRKLNSIALNSNGKTATIGGGTLQWETIRALFAKNKIAVTGLCECVSVIGPLLGGGHSYLQSQFGFASDNLVSARIILANGTLVEASSTENADLFWALRGAGHNFGVVTSFVVKVYDIPTNDQWTLYSFIYKGDQLEALFDQVNELDAPNATRPSRLITTGVLARVPFLDANPVFIYHVVIEGTESDLEPWAAPFKALSPISTTLSRDINYVELYTTTGNNLDSAVCKRNENILGSGVTLPKWDNAGLRKAYNIFSNMTADPRFKSSAVLFENYGMNGVQKIDPRSSAVAVEERMHPVLSTPIIWYEGDSEANHATAYTYASKIRDALYEGVIQANGKRHTYVNYAIGDEPKQEVYGYEDWRWEKLTGLKRTWDPMNRFRFYNPIVYEEEMNDDGR
ncbi:FAD-binding domain-containing protein [Lojkania enalia]|uniref:FAD-binding domain-containing protein n=1 Tax=Lojkania enalia TaxID=147567 RepID=A0A9P4K792_9PLEO|nr:FAD-binding domain-containing protein [Didymosphaeria enalia]